jgi:hypothetical protein
VVNGSQGFDVISAIGTGNYTTAFKCGTTSLVLFPELWNPHAQKQGTGSDNSSAAPTEFRVIAASTTPNDVLVGYSPVNSSALNNDVGLSLIPKIYDGDDNNELTTPPQHQIWWNPVVQKNFGARVTGDFYFSKITTDSPGNLELRPWLSMPSIPGGSVSFNNYGSPARNLLWSGTLQNEDTPPPSITAVEDVSSAKLYLYPIWRINFPNEAAFYQNISTEGLFEARPVKSLPRSATDPATVNYYAPSFGQYDDAERLVTNTNLVAAGAPGPTSLHPYNWYVLEDSRMRTKYYNSKNTIRIALKHDMVAKRDSTIPEQRHTAKMSFPPAPYSSVWVDFRGSELLLSGVAGSALFREPTPIAFSGSPKGMALGENNFFAGAPYDKTGILSNGYNWIGFSLGEAPSQFVVACRIEAGIQETREVSPPVVFKDNSRKREKLNKNFDYANDYFNKAMLPVDMDSNRRLVSNSSTEYPLLNLPINTHYFKFVRVPVNMISLAEDHYMTLQVQFRDKDQNWVTYDERYIKIPASATPVLFKSQATTNTNAGDPAWESGRAPMVWGVPLVSSYDPRSSRFGHPARNSTQVTSVNSGRQIERYFLNINNSSPTGFNLTATGIGPNSTDRPLSNITDSLLNEPATILTANLNSPASWNVVENYSWAMPFKEDYSTGPVFLFPYSSEILFKAIVDNRFAPPIEDGLRKPPFENNWTVNPGWASQSLARWWAQGKLRDYLWQKPSVNAIDYGWFSRHPVPRAGLSDLSTSGQHLNSGEFAGVSISNFLRRRYIHSIARPDNWATDEADALRLGSFSENLQPRYADETHTDPHLYRTANPEFRQAYADPDDVVRRAMGAFAAYDGFSGSLDGLPQGQGTGTNAANRPIVLNRAFQSVADMGYAFRGSPWKNLSFSTPETGDAALLDVFCIVEPPPIVKDGRTQAADAPADPLVAGKVNLNTRQEKVLKALLNGALKDEISSADTGLNQESIAAAQTLIGRTSSTKAWLGPLRNVSELAGRLFGRDLPGDAFNATTDPVYTSTSYKTTTDRTASEPGRNPDLSKNSNTLNWHFTGFSADLDSIFRGVPRDQKNLRMREAVIRALADGGQTRVWNIMLDLVVQTGRLVAGASDLNKFTRESERRVWVFLAIDRLTGKILDQQVEEIPD